MIKKIVSCLAAALLAVSVGQALPFSGFLDMAVRAEEVIDDDGNSYDIYTYSDYKYIILKNNTIEIYRYIGNEENVIIPSEIDNKKVSSIGNSAFYYCNSIKSITIPNTVRRIGYVAFAYLNNLEYISIPDSVEYFGINAFTGSLWLQNKQKDNPLVIINNILIDGTECKGDVFIPDEVKEIGYGAFYSCLRIKSVYIPNTVTTIDDHGFYCDLNSIIIPKSVSSIGKEAIICKIYCYSDTAAEKYAIDNYLDYELLDKITVAGDADGNGVVGVADVLLIQQYLAKWNVTINENAADVTGDGELTVADVLLLQQYLAKWNVTLITKT